MAQPPTYITISYASTSVNVSIPVPDASGPMNASVFVQSLYIGGGVWTTNPDGLSQTFVPWDAITSITAPLLRPDGSVLYISGYDDLTGLYLVSNHEWPAVAD
jgi:hypothetical protein